MKSLSVSVIIPCHNAARFIRAALDSVLGQTRAPDEIIVVDDGSDDGLQAVLEPYGSQIRVLGQAQRGVSAARNLGIKQARGDVISFLDADDFFLPAKLEHQVRLLERHPDLGLVNSGWSVVDEHGRELEAVTPWLDAPELDLRTWLLWKPVLPGAMIVRRTWLERVGGFDENLAHAEDVDLVLRLAYAGCRATWLRETTLGYRQHAANVSRASLQQSQAIENVLGRFFSLPDLPAEILRDRPRIYYHTLIWSSWQLLDSGAADYAVDALLNAVSMSGMPSLDGLMLGLVEFDQWSGPRLDTADLQPFLVSLKERLVEVHGERARPALSVVEWWSSIWRRYAARDWAEGRRALASWSPEPGQLQRRYAQLALMRKPEPGMCEVVEAFWEDCRSLGLVEAGRRYDIVTLYLTVMAWSIYTRHWKIASRALVRAAARSLHPKALLPWLRFMRAAVRYYAGGRGSASGRGLLVE
jgi:glycosyltransferase involved in cell wall biosynthesis